MAQKSKERERAARRRRGAALAPATPRALAAGRAAARRQGSFSGNRCAPRRLAASRQAVSVRTTPEGGLRARTRSEEPPDLARAPGALRQLCHRRLDAALAPGQRALRRLVCASGHPPAPPQITPDGLLPAARDVLLGAGAHRSAASAPSSSAELQALPETAAVWAPERSPPPPAPSQESRGNCRAGGPGGRPLRGAGQPAASRGSSGSSSLKLDRQKLWPRPNGGRLSCGLHLLTQPPF